MRDDGSGKLFTRLAHDGVPEVYRQTASPGKRGWVARLGQSRDAQFRRDGRQFAAQGGMELEPVLEPSRVGQ
jgi:hypothetical protein